MLAAGVRALRLDGAIAVRHVVLTLLAGSALVPRPVRWAVYRLVGLDVRTPNIFSGTRITGTDLSIGRGTFLNHDCYLDVARGRIAIGERCHLGPQVMILTATHDRDGAGGAASASRYLTTVVGDRVWLGARATVLPGVRIGDGCVVAAGAVVAADCDPGGVYGGVPARRLREVGDAASVDA
ncbi:DapH/DapD/GlmU-related protein [Nocardioides sp. CFH 31398]|uniref:acyltransferase n=1 Tax=Nocardioides sp. CFH 31398 TaxID=2919579 RepID=UPI0023DAA336|nr:acyltransferase [Nocardioides sp. CFH 31398]